MAKSAINEPVYVTCNYYDIYEDLIVDVALQNVLQSAVTVMVHDGNKVGIFNLNYDIGRSLW